MQSYDVIIIGAGPAGLTSALYSARSKLNTLYLETLGAGGQVAATDEIENYPGFARGISGFDLSLQMEEQALRFGAKPLLTKVIGLELAGPYRIVKTTKGDFISKIVIIASGATPKPLNCPGEFTYRTRGVSYCATCDGPFYEASNIIVVGGGNSAVEEACYLTKFANKVSLVHRRDALRATKIIQDRALTNPKLEFIWNTVIHEIRGDDIVQNVILKNLLTEELTEVPVNGIFIYVGNEPNTSFVKSLIELTEEGYIQTDEFMRTNIPGIYAVGDVRQKLLRQVVTAVSDGAIAAYHGEKYIEEHF
ncbi:thioredoxin-disulfide reductase [Pelosinus propionicus]|uniref:Thioredoxin reductase n=1 Tax=Pelosinus propionicus DSM 13327 TaxID=1123291 RepID=A0A1I4PJZ6_9FIRM|nr:thioredoxin-disulfide reductase [Pelosinus propionicus]SFM27773.1 thioredoxin reductase (NADPH) [Pelosinus propionicus DSM 13327]